MTAAALNAACAAWPELQVVATGCLALVAQDAAIYQPWLAATAQRAAWWWWMPTCACRPWTMLEAYRANVMAALQHAHLIKVSDDDPEALAVPGNHCAGARPLPAAADAGAMALRSTLGPDGAWLLQRDGLACMRAKMHRSRWWTPVGAGDCFLAGLITALVGRPEREEAPGPNAWRGLTAPPPKPGCAPCCTTRLASASHSVERRAARHPTTKKCIVLAARFSNGRRPVAFTRRACLPVCGPGRGDGRGPWRRWCLLPAAAESPARRREARYTASPASSPARAPRARGVAALRVLAPDFALSPLRARLRRGVAASSYRPRWMH